MSMVLIFGSELTLILQSQRLHRWRCNLPLRGLLPLHVWHWQAADRVPCGLLQGIVSILADVNTLATSLFVRACNHARAMLKSTFGCRFWLDECGHVWPLCRWATPVTTPAVVACSSVCVPHLRVANRKVSWWQVWQVDAGQACINLIIFPTKMGQRVTGNFRLYILISAMMCEHRLIQVPPSGMFSHVSLQFLFCGVTGQTYHPGRQRGPTSRRCDQQLRPPFSKWAVK